MIRSLRTPFMGLAAAALLLLYLPLSFRFTPDPDARPQVLDRRLELSLFAENPDIVTPSVLPSTA
ncbi:hypothetical protein [Nibrella viscosa]|uniref:hypothetical protein n=1 Tax=Nibrella viscosa TaxID=1084524 RepID=UPI0031EDB56C